jgi:hypothetical protein
LKNSDIPDDSLIATHISSTGPTMSKFFKTFLPKFKLPAAAAAWKGWVKMPRAHQKLTNNQGQGIPIMIQVSTPDYSAVQPLLHPKAPGQHRAKKRPPRRLAVAAATKSNNRKICSHCVASQTPQWRWSAKRHLLCNACGVYEMRCGVERPLSMITRKESRR